MTTNSAEPAKNVRPWLSHARARACHRGKVIPGPGYCSEHNLRTDQLTGTSNVKARKGTATDGSQSRRLPYLSADNFNLTCAGRVDMSCFDLLKVLGTGDSQCQGECLNVAVVIGERHVTAGGVEGQDQWLGVHCLWLQALFATLRGAEIINSVSLNSPAAFY
ncbi:hypothetical protein J6590_074782 [Homalodisca vitripennis]|nr:hypothetical protein J6590_074782 [Homalodisca vitripennis]